MAYRLFALLCALAVAVQGGIVAAPLPYVAPFASSVAAHVTHHSVAAPYVAATPVVAPIVAAPALAPTKVASPLLDVAPLVL